jgi:hypothetical protein
MTARELPGRLHRRWRDDHLAELPGQQQPREQLGVLAISLDPVSRAPRRFPQARRPAYRPPRRPRRDRTRTPSARPHNTPGPLPAARPATQADPPHRDRTGSATALLSEHAPRRQKSSEHGHQTQRLSSSRARPDVLRIILGSAGAHHSVRGTPARSVRPLHPDGQAQQPSDHHHSVRHSESPRPRV